MAIWLLNRPKRRKRNMARRRMTAKQRRYFGKRRHRRNSPGLIINRKRRRAKRPSRRYTRASGNPRKRRRGGRRRTHARRRGGSRRGGGFLRGAFGGLGRLLSIGFAFQVLGAGIGALLAVVVPNALLGTQPWYRDNPWTRIAVRAGFAVVLLPMLTGFLPGVMGGALLVGALAGVGISIIGTALNRPLSIGTGDTALSLQSFGFSGLGAYVPTRSIMPLGSYAPTSQVLPFAGSPSGGGPRI